MPTSTYFPCSRYVQAPPKHSCLAWLIPEPSTFAWHGWHPSTAATHHLLIFLYAGNAACAELEDTRRLRYCCRYCWLSRCDAVKHTRIECQVAKLHSDLLSTSAHSVFCLTLTRMPRANWTSPPPAPFLQSVDSKHELSRDSRISHFDH